MKLNFLFAEMELIVNCRLRFKHVGTLGARRVIWNEEKSVSSCPIEKSFVMIAFES